MKTSKRVGLAAIGILTTFGVACGKSDDGGGGAAASGDVAFHASAPALPGFSYDTGLQPASGPAQVSLQLSATGTITVDTVGTKSASAITGKPGAGNLALDVHIKSGGHLKVSATGYTYDGDLPGVTSIDIPIAGTTPFDGFAMDGAPPTVAANIPETKLPDIPLGSVPGHLELTVASGSQLTASFKGDCLDVSGGKATFHGETTTAGTLVLNVTIVLDIPLTKPIALPSINVPIPSTQKALDFDPVDASGVADSQTGSCTPIPVTGGDGGVDGSDGGTKENDGGDAATGPTNTVSVKVSGVPAVVTGTSYESGDGVTIGFTAPGLGPNTAFRFVGVTPGTGCNWPNGAPEAQSVDFFPDNGTMNGYYPSPLVGDCGLHVDTISPLKAQFSGMLFSINGTDPPYTLDVAFEAAP